MALLAIGEITIASLMSLLSGNGHSLAISESDLLLRMGWNPFWNISYILIVAYFECFKIALWKGAWNLEYSFRTDFNQLYISLSRHLQVDKR